MNIDQVPVEHVAVSSSAESEFVPIEVVEAGGTDGAVQELNGKKLNC